MGEQLQPIESCPDCGKQIATQADFDYYQEGEGEHLCWRKWSKDICQNDPIDWREEYNKLFKLLVHIERHMGPLAHHIGCECDGSPDMNTMTCKQITRAIRAEIEEGER